MRGSLKGVRARPQRFISMVSWVLDADIRGSTTHGSTASSRTEWRQSRASAIRTRTSAWRSLPKVGAGCGSSARPDLWRGCPVRGIPTPTAQP